MARRVSLLLGCISARELDVQHRQHLQHLVSVVWSYTRYFVRHQAFIDPEFCVRSLGGGSCIIESREAVDQQVICLHGSNNREGASELLMDHESKDTHHGSTAVVQLNSTLLELGLFIKCVPAEVDGTVTEVTNMLVASSLDVLHDAKFKGANEGKKLGEASGGDGVSAEEGGSAVGEGIEGVPGVVNVATEVDASAGDDVAEEGELRDTAVLELDVTEAVETLPVSIIEQTEGVEEAKRRLGSELGLESIESSGGLAGLGGGKGGSRSHKGGESGNFHHG